MTRRSMIRAFAASLFSAFVVLGGVVPRAAAVGPDPAEVVIVLDFSASILNDEASRSRFGAALERIADRVDETSRDLIAGDATVTLVRFASRAADVQGCTDMKLLGSPATVRKFADCLRSVATAYRGGLNDALTAAIGIDTNYVAAMEQAARHLPADGLRPTLILFSDGRHDVAGVPVTEVTPARDRLFGGRAPFALLPVGMGLDPAARGQLEAGLVALRTIREMPACATGAAFEWPQVVFESPDEAGNAVGIALQNATCTFTVAPTPVATPPPAGVVQSVRLQPRDGRIEVTWSPPATVKEQITDYLVRCTAADEEDPVESTEGVSLEGTAVVEGLTNGTEYGCEVAAVTASGAGEYTAAVTRVTPTTAPAPPAKPAVQALSGGLQISVAPDGASGVSGYHYECSADNGATWPLEVDAPSAADTAARVGALTNGVAYVCRAFAANGSGLSEPSPLSDAIKPCASALECSGLPLPVVGIVGVLLVAMIGWAILLLIRSRGTGYVIAVVDVIHTTNVGSGSKFGIRMERGPHTRNVIGIVADRSSAADLKIKKLRGDRFQVTDREGVHVTASGEPIVISDSTGTRHELVLRRFAGKAASAVSGRR